MAPWDRRRRAGESPSPTAFYQNPRLGVQLTGIQAEAVGDAQSIRLVSLTAQTPAGGGLRAEGRLQLDAAAGFPGRFEITANDARLIDTDLVDGRFRRRPAAGGRAGAGTVTVRGRFGVDRMTVRIAGEAGRRRHHDRRDRTQPAAGTGGAGRRRPARAGGAGRACRRGPPARPPSSTRRARLFRGRPRPRRPIVGQPAVVRGSVNDSRIDGSLTLDRGVLEFLSKRPRVSPRRGHLHRRQPDRPGDRLRSDGAGGRCDGGGQCRGARQRSDDPPILRPAAAGGRGAVAHPVREEHRGSVDFSRRSSWASRRRSWRACCRPAAASSKTCAAAWTSMC